MSIHLGGSFGTFISVAELPHTLVARPRLLDGVLAHWFGHDARRTLASIDGSLAWLVEHYTHYTGNERSTPRDGWHSDASYTPRWSSGAPVLPNLQVVTLLTPSEQELGAKLAAQLAIDDEQYRPGPFVLVYFAHNHHKLSRSTSTPNLAVYVTDHGIAVEDRRDKRWSWAFIATERYRLRTPSLGRTASDGRLIAADVAAPYNPEAHWLLIIDPRSGRSLSRDGVGRWRFEAGGLKLDKESLSTAQLAKLLSVP